MRIDVIHNLFRFLLNKEQGGWYSPSEIDDLLHRAQIWQFSEYLDEYAKTQKMHDALGVFKTPYEFVTSSSGIITLPENYEALLQGGYVQYYDAVAAKVRKKVFRVLNDDEIGYRLESQILAPTTIDPVGEQTQPGVIQMHPAAVYEGKVMYLKTPTKPVFGFSQTGRVITYDNATSTQLEWKELHQNKILIKAAQMAGVNLDDQFIVQYSELKDTSGV